MLLALFLAGVFILWIASIVDKDKPKPKGQYRRHLAAKEALRQELFKKK